MSENDEETFETYEENAHSMNDLTENEDTEDNMIIIEDVVPEENYFDEGFDVNEENDVEGFNVEEDYDVDEEIYVEEGYDVDEEMYVEKRYDVEENTMVISETDASEKYEEIMEQNVEKEYDTQDIAFPVTKKYQVEEFDEMTREKEDAYTESKEEEENVITLVDDYKERDENFFLDEYEHYATKDKVPHTAPAAKELLDETPEVEEEDLREAPEKGFEEEDKRKKLGKAIKLFIKLKYVNKMNKPPQRAHKILDQNFKKIFETFLKRFKKKISIDQANIDYKRIEENTDYKVKRQSERYNLYDHLECDKTRTSPYVKLKLKHSHPSAPPLNEINERREEFVEFLDWANSRYGTKHERAERRRNTTQNLIGEELRQHMKKFDLKNFNRIKSNLTTLPEVNNQMFLFSPHRDGDPKECLEVFHSGSLFVGTANVLGMNGHGTYVFPNGAVYVGHFFDNMFHGFGRILYPNKTIVEGIWYQGELTNPTVIFSDGLEYDAVNWDYLEDDDRRFATEKTRGMLPDNDIQLSNEHPARAMPPGCYDTGEGFYSIKTKCLYHPVTGNLIRIPSKNEAKWIVQNCRNNIDKNVPFGTEYLPAQFDSQLNRNEIALDCNWYKTHFPDISAEVGERIRSEIIEDLFGENYLKLKQMSQLSVPPLRTEQSPIKEDWTCIPKHRYINSKYLHCLPSSVIKLLFADSKTPDKTDSVHDENKKNTSEIQVEDNKFRLKKFMGTLQTINNFIIGKDIEWNDELENQIKYCINILKKFDEAFAHGSIQFEKVNKKTDKRFLKNVLVLWLKYGKNPSDMYQFKKLVEEIKEYKLNHKRNKKISDEESSISSTSTIRSNYRFKSLLSLHRTKYQSSKTRRKLKKQTGAVRTNEANRG